MLERTIQRKTFGKFLYEHGLCRELIVKSKSDLEAARLLTLSCADEINSKGAKGVRDKIALIEVTVLELTSRVDLGIVLFPILFFSYDYSINSLPLCPTITFISLEHRSLEVLASEEIFLWLGHW